MVVLQLLHVLPKRHKHITLSWTFVCIHFLLNAGFAKTFVQGTNVKKSYWEILSGFLCQSCTGVNLDEILPALQFFLWFCPFYLTPHSWVLGESTMAKVPCIYIVPRRSRSAWSVRRSIPSARHWKTWVPVCSITTQTPPWCQGLQNTPWTASLHVWCLACILWVQGYY